MKEFTVFLEDSIWANFMCWAVVKKTIFISVKETFWIQISDGTASTNIVAWFEEKEATDSFSSGSNREILWGHTGISYHELQSEVSAEKQNRGSLDPDDLCSETSMFSRAKATHCHREVRGWVSCVFSFIYSLPLPFSFHWLSKREEKNPASPEPNEQCSFLPRRARGSLAFCMPKKLLTQSTSHCDIHVWWQRDFSKHISNVLSWSVHTGKVLACSQGWCLKSHRHILSLLLLP